MLRLMFILVCNAILVSLSTLSMAQSPGDEAFAATDDFSQRMIAIIKGPVLKLLAAVILLVGIAGLLRGRNKLALSCGMAFLLLLFLPVLLGHVK
jgi:type IV secretory pathway VirB2 component (pilin)